MNNKKLGIGIIILSILIAVILFSLHTQLTASSTAACGCVAGTCPHADKTPYDIYTGIAVICITASLGIYLVFFEKSQKEIITTLEKQKQLNLQEEKFEILLKGLGQDEKKVIKAVKEQDGITQQTLRLRTDMHKSKLSIVLDSLEKKDLIKRVPKGKTKQIFLKLEL